MAKAITADFDIRHVIAVNPALNSGAAIPLYLSIHPFTHLLTGFAILNSVDSCSAWWKEEEEAGGIYAQ